MLAEPACLGARLRNGPNGWWNLRKYIIEKRIGELFFQGHFSRLPTKTSCQHWSYMIEFALFGPQVTLPGNDYHNLLNMHIQRCGQPPIRVIVQYLSPLGSFRLLLLRSFVCLLPAVSTFIIASQILFSTISRNLRNWTIIASEFRKKSAEINILKYTFFIENSA